MYLAWLCLLSRDALLVKPLCCWGTNAPAHGCQAAAPQVTGTMSYHHKPCTTECQCQEQSTCEAANSRQPPSNDVALSPQATQTSKSHAQQLLTGKWLAVPVMLARSRPNRVWPHPPTIWHHAAVLGLCSAAKRQHLHRQDQWLWCAVQQLASSQSHDTDAPAAPDE